MNIIYSINISSVKLKGAYFKRAGEIPCPFLFLSRRLDIDRRGNITLNQAVFLFKFPYILTNQNQHVAVYAAPLIIRHIPDFLQHFLLNSYRYTLNSHAVTSRRSSDQVLYEFFHKLQLFIV